MLSVVHLYASRYGWSREYILDNVFVDEHILQQEMIVDSQRNDWLMESQIALLANFKDEDREKFLNSLIKEEAHKPIDIPKETDLDAIRKAKEQMELIKN